MKRSREFFLWTFFLAVCFWAGYLKGILPLSFQQSLLVKGPVRLLNAAPFNLPPEFIKTLESDLGQKVEVQRVHDWDALQAKLVTRSGPHLILAPSFWAADLERENLLLKLTPVAESMESRLSADFISLQGQNLFVLPLYWTVTHFRVHQDSPLGESLLAALTNKNLSEIHLYPDPDIMVSHLGAWAKSLPGGGLRLKDIQSYKLTHLPAEIAKTALWEVPRLLELPHTRALNAPQGPALLIYGMMAPRNSPNRKLSYHLLEKMMDPGLQEVALARLPFGSTLSPTEGEFKIKKEQRATELRDLKLHELIILEKRKPALFQEYWQKYNFIAPN